MRLSGLCGLARGEEKSALGHRTLWPAPSCLAREREHLGSGRAGQVLRHGSYSGPCGVGDCKGGSRLRAEPQFRSWVGRGGGAQSGSRRAPSVCSVITGHSAWAVTLPHQLPPARMQACGQARPTVVPSLTSSSLCLLGTACDRFPDTHDPWGLSVLWLGHPTQQRVSLLAVP